MGLYWTLSRFTIALSLVVCVAGSALALAGCSSTAADDATKAAGSASPSFETAEEAVRGFYDSKTKHGFATFTSGGSSEEVEFWFDEDGRYRLTWYYPEEKAEEIEQFGPVRIHMISPDGTAVYYCRPESEACELAYTTAEKQQWTFNGPPDWTPGSGVEEEGYTVFTYQPEKLWDIEGASQQFYLYDMKVYAEETRIDRVVMRTASKLVPVEELTDSEFKIGEFELDTELPSDIFELPYETVTTE